jgi:hypothetical protein
MKLGSTVSKKLNYYVGHKLKYVLHNNESADDLRFNFIMRDAYDNTYRLIRNIYTF